MKLPPHIINPNPNINKENFAWCAGIFDGEGHIGFYSKSSGIQLNISQKDPEILIKFKNIVGVGKIYKKKNSYAFVICNHQEIQYVVALIWVWLGTIKRNQAEKALNEAVHSFFKIRKERVDKGKIRGPNKRSKIT